MTGTFFAVVGASGVGKDAVLSASRPTLEATGNYHYPTRLITRPANAGAEDHNSISTARFSQGVTEGCFSLWWTAHELHYALPGTVFEELQANRHVIANISRGSIGEAIQKFGSVEVIEITADPDTIHKRLLARGRESKAEVVSRQRRKVEPEWAAGAHVTTISNDGTVEEAADEFISAVFKLSGQTAPKPRMA